MHLTGIDLLLWALTLLEHIVLLAVLIFRHRARRFPAFTALIATNVFRTIVLYFTLRHAGAEAYFYTYWSFAFLDIALQFVIVYELVTHVFRPVGAWDSDVRRIFLWLSGASLLVASLLTWLDTPATRSLRATVVMKGEFFSSALMAELFVIMLALSFTMGFPWRTHVARITQGFGVYSIFGILTNGAHSYFGTASNTHTYSVVSHIRISLYCVCVAYWIFGLAKEEPENRQMPEQLRLELRDLQRRTAMLLQSLRGSGRA